MAETTVGKSDLLAPDRRSDTVPFFNDYLAFRADPLKFWQNVAQIGPLVRVKFGPVREMWVVNDPDLFQQILQTKWKNFPRDRQLRDRNGIDTAQTVFNAESDVEWRWRRRLLQPGFHRKRLAKFAETMVAETEKLALESAVDDTLNLTDFMKKLTMRIICQTMFSASLEETDRLQYIFEQTSEFSYKQMSAIVKTPTWLPTPMIQETKRSFAAKKEILGRIVQERFDSGEQKDDMLEMLIAAQLDEDAEIPAGDDSMVGRQFDQNDLVAEMGSLVFAGHETTAMTMVWLIYLVATNRELEEKLLAEIESVLGGRSATLDDIDQMPFTHQVIQETLRMYPSVYVTLREAEAADELIVPADENGQTPQRVYHVPAGTQFLMNIRGLHHLAAHWPEPDQFRPERFAPENSALRHKFAYQPFISGPKKCIGDSFAMMEMRLAVPTLLQKLRFEFASPHPAQPAAGFVMETAEPVMMNVKRKN